jgi:hypothetical protein
MVNNLVGPPVLGPDFVGRRSEIASAWSNLTSGNSLLLASPRRVGKSSFSHKLIEIAQNNEWNTIYLDLQGIETENKFAEVLLKAVKAIREKQSPLLRTTDRLKELFSKVRKVEVSGVGVEFEEQINEFYDELEKKLFFDKKTLIVVDELAVFLQALLQKSDFGRVELFMNWIRKIRQQKSEQIAWVFCSSISITSFVSQNKLSHTINDLYPFNLGEMTDKEAESLLEQLCAGAGITPFTQKESATILNRIGWKLPFFIQLFFRKYTERMTERKEAELKDMIDDIFDQIIHEHQLFTWSERLSGYGRYESVARTLLNYLCQPEHRSDRAHLETIVSPDCERIGQPNEVYAEVKQMLDNDGYLMSDKSGNIFFRSPIIREYWFSKYVQ